MKRRKDYEAHYYLPLTVPANAVRDSKEVADRYVYHEVDTLSSSGFPNEVGDLDSDLAKGMPEFAQGVDQQTNFGVYVNCQFFYCCKPHRETNKIVNITGMDLFSYISLLQCMIELQGIQGVYQVLRILIIGFDECNWRK